MRTRSVADRLDGPHSSIRRALLLAAGVAPADYHSFGFESLEFPVSPPLGNVLAAREGIARWSNVLGGWYWHENEDRFKSKARDKERIGLGEMKRISALDKGAREVAATSVRIANNRILRALARWAARHGDSSGQETLRHLGQDPEGPLRELRIPGFPSAFEFLRTPLAKKIAAMRGVEYAEKDIRSFERRWRRSFRLRDERKDL